jgi:Spy/CpxP family protein refolding chaperone
MRTATTVFPVFLLALAMGLQAVPTAGAEDPSGDLKAIHAKLESDKKDIVTQYMNLSEQEAKAFWPVYDEIQTEQAALSRRTESLLSSYAAELKSNTFTDEKAQKLLDEWIQLGQDEARQRAGAAAKVMKALPGKKAARYLQIESEYRALRNYDLAATVPLAR